MIHNNYNNRMWKRSIQLYFTLIQFNLFVTYSIYNHTDKFDTQITNKFINYLSDLIRFYDDYDISFHFDSKNNDLIDKLTTNLDFNTTSAVILINYDWNNSDLIRLQTKQILHLVALNNPNEFIRYSKDPKPAQRRDVIHFVLQDKNISTELMEIPGLNLFGNLLYIVFKGGVITTYKVCYFCGNSSGKAVKLENNFSTDLRARNFSNLYGHLFKVTFINYFPLVWCEKTREHIFIDNKQYRLCVDLKGTEYQLINVVSKLLNFQVIPVLHEDDYLGTINQTGHGVFDVAMGGITVTPERCKLATFTTMYWYESYNCLFFCNKNSSDLLSFLEPLQGILWISIAAACLLTTLSFALIGRHNKRDISQIPGSKIFWLCMQLLVDQQAPQKSITKLRKRSLFVIIAWYLMCLNINTAYKSKLLSTLLNPTHKEPQDLAELLEEGFSIVTNANYDDVVSNLFRNVNTKYKKVLSHPINIDNVCDEFDYAANHLATVIDEYTSLQYEVRNSCREKIKKNQAKIPQARITRPLNLFGHGWAMQKGAPFEQAFNAVINRVVRAGLILKWRQDATRHMDHNKSVFAYSFLRANEKENDGQVHLETLISPFFVYLLGNLFAAVVFAAEITYHKKLSAKICCSDQMHGKTAR